MNSTPIAVSVIIPTYNSASTLAAAIESVLGQSFKGFEIIVVDDGSTDDTRSVLSEYIDQGKIIYLLQKNQGCGVARNNGARIAKGEFVAFLDGDDYWHAEKLAQQMEMFKKFPECIVCYTDAYEIDPYHAVIWEVRQSTAGKLRSGKILPHMVIQNFITLSSAMMKTELFRKVGGFTSVYNLMMFADYDLWLKLAPMGEFYPVQTPLVFYQTRLEISRKQKIKNHREVMSVFMVRIKESSSQDIPWYVFGLLLSTGKWLTHCILSILHL